MEPTEPNLLSDLKRMFDECMFTDFELKSSDDQVFKVHKSVLAARSPVFYAMLTSEMKESKKNFANICNIEGATLKELLRFVYYNGIENLPAVAVKLIQAADQYQLDKLKTLCCDSLIETLTPDNVINRFILSDGLTGCKKFHRECINMIIE